ncbi:diguanylate cyclase [Prosthecochloris sp. ZM]|nr:diguanylate cyclase [Prosthecochloris sp. ZM]
MYIYKDFHFRLREYILKKHGSVSAFCRAVGIKYPAQMTPYLKGQSMPGKKMLDKLEKDGADIGWILHGKPKHQPGGMGASLMTSSYKVEMEQIMRRMRLLSQQMNEALPVSFQAYAVLNSSLVFEEFTRSFEKFLGYEPGGLTGMHFPDLIHPDDRQTVREYLASDHAGGTPRDLVSRFVMADGRSFVVEWSFYANNLLERGCREYVILATRSN